MQIEQDGSVFPSGFPVSLLPGFGYVVLQHANLDHTVNEAIWHLAGVDRNAGIAITSAVSALGVRIEVLRRLVIVKVTEKGDRDKLDAISQRIGELSSVRNRLMHERHYWTNQQKQEAGYFRMENFTRPQIRIQPPVTINAAVLDDLGNELSSLATWLGMFTRQHPVWSDDTKFPWRDKLPQDISSSEVCPTCGRSSRATRRKASPKSPRPRRP